MIQTRVARCAFAALAAAVGLSLLATKEASAKGCNGVVNQAVWGCAPWDNNNGPKFPNYKKPAPAQVAAPKPTVAPARPIAAPPSHVVQPNGGAGIVSGGAGNIVSGGAGNIVSGGAGNMRNK